MTAPGPRLAGGILPVAVAVVRRPVVEPVAADHAPVARVVTPAATLAVAAKAAAIAVAAIAVAAMVANVVAVAIMVPAIMPPMVPAMVAVIPVGTCAGCRQGKTGR